MTDPSRVEQYPVQYPTMPYQPQPAAYYPPPEGYPAAAYSGQQSVQFVQAASPGGAVMYQVGQSQVPGQVVVVTAAAPATSPYQSAMKPFGEKIKTPYGIFRALQLVEACVLLGLVCGLLSSDPNYWYYWLWLLIVPLGSIATALSQLFSKNNITWAYGGGGDIAFAIFYLVEAGSIGMVYYFAVALVYEWSSIYWEYVIISYGFDEIANAAMAFCGLLSLSYWITGCSALCCHCLGRP